MNIINENILINERISSILTKPKLSTDTSHPSVILLHGFAMDKDEVNGFYIDLANKLAMQGIISLRIDFTGWGDSSGDKIHTTIDSLLNDAQDAYDYLINNNCIDTNRIGICGFSLGAAITMLFTEKNINIKKIGLISPVGNLYEDFHNVFGADFFDSIKITNNPIHVPLMWRDDVYLNKAFFKSLKDSSVLNSMKVFNGNIIAISGDQDFSAAHVRRLQQAYPNTQNSFNILPNQDHIFHTFDDNSQMAMVNEKLSAWFKAQL